MPSVKRNLLWLGLALSTACAADAGDPNGASRGALAASARDEGDGDGGDVIVEDGDRDSDGDGAAGDGADGEQDDDEVPTDLECPQGTNTGPVRVVFECDEIVVVTCKDLSNVVIELEDGTRQRFEGLSGHENRFSVDGPIVGVWVKAGANHSGEGPGYGERVDAPEDNCEPGGGDAPSDGSDAPADGGDAPSDGNDAPSDGGDAPSDGGDDEPPSDGILI